MDSRVKPIVMLVKKWAKTHGINDASQGTLSSYALTLMVIHYLQGKIEADRFVPLSLDFFAKICRIISLVPRFCGQNIDK